MSNDNNNEESNRNDDVNLPWGTLPSEVYLLRYDPESTLTPLHQAKSLIRANIRSAVKRIVHDSSISLIPLFRSLKLQRFRPSLGTNHHSLSSRPHHNSLSSKPSVPSPFARQPPGPIQMATSGSVHSTAPKQMLDMRQVYDEMAVVAVGRYMYGYLEAGTEHGVRSDEYALG